MGLVVVFVAVLLAMKFFVLPLYVISIIITGSLFISIYICCFSFGYAFFNPIHLFEKQAASWKRFVLGLTLGGLCGFFLALLGNLFLTGSTGFHLPTSSSGLEYFSAAIGIFIGIGNGESSRILVRIRREPVRSIALFSWNKFGRGFLLGSLTTIWASLLFCWNFVFFDASMYDRIANVFLSQIQDLYPDVNFYIIFGLVVISLVFGLIVGLIVGFILAFGHVILFKIEQLSEKRIGQIGIFFLIVGVILDLLSKIVSS
jgi:hypothetical protein